MSRVRATVAALSLTLVVCVAAASPAAAARPPRSTSTTGTSTTGTDITGSGLQVGPFTEPSFAATCAWHSFGEGESPPFWLLFVNPLCVEYSKRNITVDNGGALAFLLAEPARFAAALSTCRYYQKDHWSVQASLGTTPWVSWDGQYWWDSTAGRAGARLTNFRIAGQPAGIGDVVAALRAHGFPNVAAVLSDYGQSPGESGATVAVPVTLPCALAG